MQINITYDSSVANAPTGFQTAVQAAVQYLDSAFAAPITVNIDIGWGEIDGQALPSGSVGASLTNGVGLNYTEVRNALWQDAVTPDALAAAQSLPATDPTNGGTFFVATAEAKALGLIDPNSTQIDGYVGLDSSTSFTFDPNNRSVAGEVDAIGVLEHEITEVLGRDSYLGVNSNGASLYSPMDLFRYTAPGVLAPSSATGSFSINGQTLLMPFNNPVDGGDAGDWSQAVTGDSFDAFVDVGTADTVSANDLRLMDVLGYHAVPVLSTPTPAVTPTSTTLQLDQQGLGTNSYQLTASSTQTLYFLDPTTVQGEAIRAVCIPGGGTPFSLTNAGTIVDFVDGGFYGTQGITTNGVEGAFDATRQLSLTGGVSFNNLSGAALYVHSAVVSAYGVYAGANTAISNAGLVQVVCDNGFAFGFEGVSPLYFTNSSTGVVKVSGKDFVIGVNFTDMGTFSNAGLIDVIGTATPDTPGQPPNSPKIFGVWDPTTFNNSGTISVVSLTSEAPSIGVFVDTTQGLANVGGVSVETFTNSGTVEADRAFDLENGADNTINNTGKILGDVVLGGPAETINNSGTIAGTIYFSDGNQTYNGASGQLLGSIVLGVGSSTVTLGANGGTVFGGGGNDTLTGGSGNDLFEIYQGNSSIDGGGGFNTLSFADADLGVTVNLSTGTASAAGTDTVKNIQEVIGSDFGDTMIAGSSSVTFVSGTGNSTLTGGAGNDTLIAGSGGDTMSGGGGNNTFIYSAGDHQLVISDFGAHGDQDVLDIYGYASAISIQQQGANALITLPSSDTILLDNVQASSLTGSKVVFNTNAYQPPIVPSLPVFGTTPIQFDNDLVIHPTEHINIQGYDTGFTDFDAGTLDNFGNVAVGNSGNVTGLAAQVSSPFQVGQILNESGGTFAVVSTNGQAVGFTSSPVAAPNLKNSGQFTVSGSTLTYGIYTGYNFFTFTNAVTGVFSVTSVTGEADGVYAPSEVDVQNAGTISVTGATLAVGIRENLANSDSIGNSGTITVTAGPGGRAIGILVTAQQSSSQFSISNSGTITAQTAISDGFGASSPYAPSPLAISNTGKIVGNVDIGGINTSLTSTGTITGNILLHDDVSVGAGSGDTVDLRGGTFNGDILITPGLDGSSATLSDTIYTGSNSTTIEIAGGESNLTTTIIAGAGSNTTVQFDIASTAATITHNANGTWTVAAGTDGIETLTKITSLKFTDKTITIGSSSPAPSNDFLGSGFSDIFVRNSSGQDAILSSNGNGTFNAFFTSTVANTAWFVAAAGDFNGDGKADLIWRNSSTGEDVLWQSNGDGTFATSFIQPVTTDWSIVGSGDFNGDGKTDLLWRNSTTGQDVVWLSNGNGTFAAAYAPTVGTGSWTVAGIGDFNGDGKADVLWRNSSTGEDVIWTSNGDGTFGEAFTNPVSTDWSVVGVGDFNGDGKADILWRNNSGQDVIWTSNGNGTFGAAFTLSVPTTWTVVAIGDYNGDGKADIYWRDTATGDNVIWQSNGDGTFNLFAIQNFSSTWTVVPAQGATTHTNVSLPATAGTVSSPSASLAAAPLASLAAPASALAASGSTTHTSIDFPTPVMGGLSEFSGFARGGFDRFPKSHTPAHFSASA